jgi:ATP-binding protein involved in chromosome partitioning
MCARVKPHRRTVRAKGWLSGILVVFTRGELAMSAAETRLRERLAALPDPHHGGALGAEFVRAVGVDGTRVALELELPYPAQGWWPELEQAVRAAAQAEGLQAVSVAITTRVRSHGVQQGLQPLVGVRNIIAVASGKGGVGKSTVSANLALALAAEGAQVGVLDADIYGPSQQRMLGLSGQPESPDGKRLKPMRAHGLQVMSIGVLVSEDTPMIWRGPMVTQTLMQLLQGTAWDNLDYLIIDLPPGTGDIQLTLAQRVPVSGAVIVTTPQDIALLDAMRALKMFQKVSVPVLGIVENMATHVCSNCGHEEHIFGAGGGERMAREYQLPLLGALPLDIRIREQMDAGVPTVVAQPDSDLALRYREIARRTAARLAQQALNKAIAFPKIVVE